VNAFQMAATQLIDTGIVPLSLYDGTKIPKGEGWQNSAMPTSAQLTHMFPDDEPCNIGALMGAASGYAQGVDFDVYAAFSRWKGEYKPPNTRIIFTARGLRAIYRTEPEALRTSALTLNGARVGEFLADGAQMVMPPSRLKDGFEYTDNGLAIAYMPPEHPAFLALQELIEQAANEPTQAEIATGKRKLARFAKAALDGRITIGKRFESRSELDAALIQSLARSGFDADEIYNMLDSAALHSHWHERKEKSRRDDIARVISKFANTNSQISREAILRAETLKAYRESAIWPSHFDTGRTKLDKNTGEIKPVFVMHSTIKAVLLAHETKVRDCLTYRYHLDSRAGDGRFANIGRQGFERATKILVNDGILRRVKAAKGTCAHVYELPTEKELVTIAKGQAEQWLKAERATLEGLREEFKDAEMTMSKAAKARAKRLKGQIERAEVRISKLANYADSGHFNTTGAQAAQDGVEVAFSSVVSAGVFDCAGLGRTAYLVYLAALAKPIKAKALAVQTGYSIRTIEPTLTKLGKYGLVEKRSDDCWQSDAAVNWHAVGEYLNTTTRVQAKQQQTRARREARANSYKLHCPQHARITPDSELSADLNTPAKRTQVKARNAMNQYGERVKTLDVAADSAALAAMQDDVAAERDNKAK